MRVGVPKETADGERRVGLVPDVIRKLVARDLEVVVESGAGEGAMLEDAAFADAGAQIGDPWGADVVVKVSPPTPEEIARLGPGSVLVGFLAPRTRPAVLEALAGAGVAGLQAIATARRLGAVVTGYDVRSAVAEQVQSLGATFLELEAGKGAEGEGGYARELTEEERDAQQRELTEAITGFDVVITTALVPGRPAPRLVSADAVRGMRSGSVIVDLASEAGGNCELTEPGQTVVREDVTIIGELNLPATMPEHASSLYARNVQSFLELVTKEGELKLDFDDEVVSGACVVRAGEVSV
jgi:NAD(P) transhydrogenase subunit alpha